MFRFSAILVLGLFAHLISGQYEYVESPCPDVFGYKSDGGGVYGVIHLKPSRRVSYIQIRANFTIPARLISNYVGRIEPIAQSSQILQDYNRGVPIKYRVQFPVTSPLPRLTALTVNDQVICFGPADIPGPTQYVTTTSLQHTLVLMQGQSPGFDFDAFDSRPPKPQKPDPIIEYIGTLPEDGTLVFTISEDDRHGSFDSINSYPYFIDSDSRPPPAAPAPTSATRPPRPSRPTPPLPQHYPEPQPEYPPPTEPLPVSPPGLPAAPDRAPVQCGVVAGGNERQPLIFNGQGYSRGDWPWLTAIYKRKDGSLTFICAGTLVSNRHVITAAHCMQLKNTILSIKDVVVKVGVYNLEDWGDDVTVTRTLASATIHHSYNATSLANDILVLTFERSVEFNTNVRPACLWDGNTDLSRIVGASGVVAGWGQSERGPAGRGEPRVVRIPVVSTAVCRSSNADFHKLTSANTLCAGDRNGAGPCLGDSGGGLYILERGRWRLRGVVSVSLRPTNGDSTCNLDQYIVFTDSAQYLSWIESAMVF